MAGDENSALDDLDAFFSAAANADTDALNQAAEQVAGTRHIPVKPEVGPVQPIGKPAAGAVPATQIVPESDSVLLREIYSEHIQSNDGKYIAIDPESIAGNETSDPFVLVPANVHTMLPWWAWATIAMSLITLIAVWVLMPPVLLNRLTSRLGDDSPAAAQSVMRQLVLKGDRETIGKLYEMASSSETGMTTRLRAVDTLSLIKAAEADRALLRLELASSTDDQVREAAIAARKQREAAKSRSRPR